MSAPAQESVVFTIRPPLTRADLPGLCERVCALLPQSPGGLAFCDVTGVAADCVAVDALARLQLAACRRRCKVRLRNASDELLELVEFMGLHDVLAA
jgi:ABC-type transporter Mla MlaB component